MYHSVRFIVHLFNESSCFSSSLRSFVFCRRLPPFRWLWSTKWCCKPHDSGTLPLGNGTTVNGTAHGRFHNHNSSDSMRTLTTSLTVSRRSCLRPARVVIVERPKTEHAMSEV